MRKAFILSLLFLVLPGCLLNNESGLQKIGKQERVQDTQLLLPLPGRVVMNIVKSLNDHAKVTQSGLDSSSFQYYVWVPQFTYIPNNIFPNDVFNSENIWQIPEGLFFYPLFVLFWPPFLDYSWKEIKGSTDISRTEQLRKKLIAKEQNFYRDLNRPQSKGYDSYSNEYLWTTKSTRISIKWGSIWRESYKGERRNQAQFLSISERIIQGDFLEGVQDRMRGRPTPELNIKQSRFESTRHYLHRMGSAKEKLNSFKNTLFRMERKEYKAVEAREKLIIYRLFVLYFGRPIIAKISYNPDTRLFGIRVKGKYGGVFLFTLADRIMNEEATDYEKRIEKASPKILLRVSGRRLYIDGGYLVFSDGTMERILPFHEAAYQSKDITIASFPKIEVPKFSPPKKILPNERMKSEGEKIVSDTVYFQGLK